MSTVYKGATVEEFDRICFRGSQEGDTAIVYGESSGYAGYHVMYYVGRRQPVQQPACKERPREHHRQPVGGRIRSMPEPMRPAGGCYRRLINPYLSTGEETLTGFHVSARKFMDERTLRAPECCWARARWTGCGDGVAVFGLGGVEVVVRGSARPAPASGG